MTLYAPPETVVELLSPGSVNERRDREAALKLYSRRGVDAYWIADWWTRRLAVYRRDGDVPLSSPLLPRCAATLAQTFVGLLWHAGAWPGYSRVSAPSTVIVVPLT